MTMVEVHDLSRAIRRARIIQKALKGAHPDESRSLLCWTLARVCRGSGLTKDEFAALVLRDFKAGVGFQNLNRLPTLP